MSAFLTPVDIANRALQHVGTNRIDDTLGFAEQSKNAAETAFCYDKLRRAELQRNTWRFAVRRTVIRPIDATTRLLAPSLWVSVTTYFAGSIVTDDTGAIWISQAGDNLGNDPQNSLLWQQYFGPMTVSLYDSGTAYYAGELVYTAAGDGTYRAYLSLANGNSDNPATPTAWDVTATYSQDQVVTYSSVAYKSLVDLNTGNQPDTHATQWTNVIGGGAGSLNWLEIGGAEFPTGVGLTTLNIIYPLGSGPSSQSASRSVFHLPSGYLKLAPQDPKAGSVSYLGAPSNLGYTDWEFEGDYIVSTQVDIIVLRFVTDIIDVRRMTDMFCEGLACRVAIAVCEPLTQSTQKLASIASEYQKFMGEARTANAIEAGADEPPLDDYLACRF